MYLQSSNGSNFVFKALCYQCKCSDACWLDNVNRFYCLNCWRIFHLALVEQYEQKQIKDDAAVSVISFEGEDVGSEFSGTTENDFGPRTVALKQAGWTSMDNASVFEKDTASVFSKDTDNASVFTMVPF